MKFKVLFQIILLLASPVNSVFADEARLLKIGDHPVHQPPLEQKEDLCKMMKKEKVLKFIEIGLKQASCFGVETCSVFYKDIKNLFDSCDKNKFIEIEYEKETAFWWMMFRTNGVGNIKIAKDFVWGGENPIPAYQFTITKDDKEYIFAVPKGCGNLALLKTDCPTCEGCSNHKCEGVINIELLKAVNLLKAELQSIKKDYLFTSHSYEYTANTELLKEINLLKAELQSIKKDCLSCVDKHKPHLPVDPLPPLPTPCTDNRDIHFLADLGYFRQSDPADYLFGRFGIEYKPFATDSSLKDMSLLTMIGVAPRIKGDDGDDALLLDVIAQYNLPSPNMFFGLGLGGWFTSGDVQHDSADSDLDIIANVGMNVGEFHKADIAVFFEIRSAVDELDSLAEYGRFGAGVRFRF